MWSFSAQAGGPGWGGAGGRGEAGAASAPTLGGSPDPNYFVLS